MKAAIFNAKWTIAIIFATITVAILLLQNSFRGETTHADVCTQNQLFLARAFDQYKRDHGCYPPAYTLGKDGAPLHSWRVLLLPYLGKKDVYDLIRLDEAWDSEYNTQFHDMCFPMFHCPARKSKRGGRCDYAILVGEHTVFPMPAMREHHNVANQYPMVLIVEPKEFVACWMEPKDIVLDGSKNFCIDNNLGWLHHGETIITFTDCSVKKMAPEEMKSEVNFDTPRKLGP